MRAFTRDSVPAFLSELKRRHVFRVAVVYIVVAWAIAQVSDTVFPRLYIPDVAVTLVIILLILGFPLTLVLAWAYDITPQGVERTPPAGSAAGEERGGASETARPGADVAPEGRARTAASMVERPGPSAGERPVAGATDIRTIVALPFANLAPGEDGDYLSDGITEELISALGRVPGLRVVGRTSAFALKNRALDIREIGVQLGVDAAVEGSVRRAGKRVRINVQLTDVRAGYQLWSDTYDRELEDVLGLQEEIARSLVTALRLRNGVGGRALVGSATGDAQAYRHYLQGRFYWNQRTGESLRRAIRSFEAAVATDPSYALAYAGLADCHSILLDYGLESPAETYPRALDAARRAVELSPGLAETHTSLALVRQVGCDWAEAESGFRRAFERAGDHVVAHHRYALLLAWRGRDGAALGEIGRARDLDPLSPIVATTVGWIHYWGRRPDVAAGEHRRVLAEEPGFITARVALGLACLQLGDPAEAVKHLATAAELSGYSPGVLPLLAMAHAAAGEDAEAAGIGQRLEAVCSRSYVSPYYQALARLAVDDRAGALALLEEAVAERSPQVAYLKVEPLLDGLRSDPRFADALARTGLDGPLR